MATREPRSTAKGSRRSSAAKPGPEMDADSAPASIAHDLSYSEARTALDLALAQLQATDLDVEAMAGLFQRAQSYAQRCEALLAEVEQQVLLWDSTTPGDSPQPYGGATG